MLKDPSQYSGGLTAPPGGRESRWVAGQRMSRKLDAIRSPCLRMTLGGPPSGTRMCCSEHVNQFLQPAGPPPAGHALLAVNEKGVHAMEVL